MSESDRVVIVGAGHAAGECATALRQEGFSGPIQVIGAERHLPYQRPPLSKAYLAGQLEVAAVAIKHGLAVIVLEALPRVLARVTAPEISAFYERVHGEAGVDVRTHAAIESFELDNSGDAIAAVRTSRGRIATDLVIAGIGLEPNVELASAAGLETEDGICVDEFTRTSDPDIHAIGDCANQPNAALGRRLRLESVPNAVEQGRAAAAVIAGKPRAYQPVPWFWSDQYDLKLQMVGISRTFDQLVIRGSTAERYFIGFYLCAGRIIAADAVSRPVEFMVAKRMVAACAVVDPARLADCTVPLKSLIAP